MSDPNFLEAEKVITKQACHCVIIVDEALSTGLLANAAAVVALTLGSIVDEIPGPPLVDADGGLHPGLIPQGVAVLSASAHALGELRSQAAADPQLVVVDFPADGQQTNDYREFRRRVAALSTAELLYLAVLIYGPRNAVRRVTGSLPLLR